MWGVSWGGAPASGASPCTSSSHHNVLQVNALTFAKTANALSLAGPYAPSAKALDALRAQRRMQPLAVGALAEAGMKALGWVHPAETSLALDAVISCTGLHLYSRGDGRRGELASYTFTGSLVSWVPVKSILVITIVDGHDDEEGGGAGGGGASYGSMLNLGAAAAPKRLKNISLHSHEAKLMSQLLTAFAAAGGACAPAGGARRRRRDAAPEAVRQLRRHTVAASRPRELENPPHEWRAVRVYPET